MFNKLSKPFLGFLQASSLVNYIFVVSTFLNNVERIFNNGTSEFVAAITMLLLFIISAVISAVLVLGRASVLFWERKYSEAFTLIAWSIGWGIFYLTLFLALLYISQ